MSRLIRLFPKRWRRRYGEEVADLLASSSRPWRDRADLVVAAFAVRVEGIGSMRNLRIAVAALVAAGLLGAFWATPRLTHGVREIPEHWWSTLAVLPAVVGAGLMVLATAYGRLRRAE